MNLTETKKPSRKRRSPSGDDAKKIVSLTIDPTLVAKIDKYAAERKISRSATMETAIIGLLALSANSPIATAREPENSLVQSGDCLFASPQLGQAIFY